MEVTPAAALRHRTPAIVVDDNLARAVDIDAVGRHHERKRLS